MILLWRHVWTIGYGLGIILAVWIAITISHVLAEDATDECFAKASHESAHHPILIFGCGRDPSTYIGIKRMPHEDQYVDMLVLAPDVFPQCATVASFLFNHQIAPAGITVENVYAWTDFVLCNDSNETGVYMPFLETSQLLSAINKANSLTFIVGKSASSIHFKNKTQAIQKFRALSQQLFAAELAA